MVAFGAIWTFPIKIASHSERLSKYLSKNMYHEPLFFRERSGVLVSTMFSLSGKAMGAEASFYKSMVLIPDEVRDPGGDSTDDYLK